MTRRSRIAVVGSANVDLTTFSDRFPKAGETIFGEHFDLGWGGKGANQAVAARLCGAEVSMVARVGDDLFGPATITNFAVAGHRCVARAASCRRLERRGADLRRVERPEPDHRRQGRQRSTAARRRGRGAAGARDRRLHRAAVRDPARDRATTPCASPSQRGIRCIVNPAPGPAGRSRARSPASTTSCPTRPRPRPSPACPCARSTTRKRAPRTCCGKGLQRVIITLGEKGALARPRWRHRARSAPTRVATKDTTGAGDAFVGSFAVFLGEGLAERDAIARANLYAALSTMGVGTQKSFVTREQFDDEWRTRAAKGPLVAP